MTLIDQLDPAILTGEPFTGITDLARAIGAEGIARDARRLDERTRSLVPLDGELAKLRGHIFEQLCVRLHHHVETMWNALVWTDADESARIHSLTICRLLCESVLERSADGLGAARVRFARWLAVERTKFLMGTTADARVELHNQIAVTNRPRHEVRRTALAAADAIGGTAVARFRTRIGPEVGAAITAITQLTLRDLYAGFGDLARSVPELMFTLLDVDTLPPSRGVPRTAPAAGVVGQLADRIGLASRVRIDRDAHGILVALLEDGSRAATEAALERYDAARVELEERCGELLDDAIAATRACGVFARKAHLAGPAKLAETRLQLKSWATRLDRLTGRHPGPL